MDEQKQPQQPAEDSEPERPDEAIKDLEPSAEDADTIKGGGGQGTGRRQHEP